jgi:hypothetical protein
MYQAAVVTVGDHQSHVVAGKPACFGWLVCFESARKLEVERRGSAYHGAPRLVAEASFPA